VLSDSHCLATVRGDTHTDTQTDERDAFELGSGAMICMKNFLKIGSGTQKLMGGGDIHTEQGDLISLVIFYSKMREGG
jgi:hypothetical protein